MRKTEPEHSRGQLFIVLILGALLALGIALIVILLGSIAVSLGILKPDADVQAAVAACLLGCFAGGRMAAGTWRSKRLIAGLLTGGLCFLLILLIALLSGNSPSLGGQMLAESAGCLLGGGIAGVFAGGKHKKRKKGR